VCEEVVNLERGFNKPSNCLLEKRIFWCSSLLVLDVSSVYIETEFLETEARLQDIGFDYMVELLDSHSAPFTKDELTNLDMQTCRRIKKAKMMTMTNSDTSGEKTKNQS
jgi:hypothetical protein